MTIKVIDVGNDFSRFPGGRVRNDGRYSAEAFREDILLPALRENEQISLHLDSTAGYGSSFLEETFGGLVRLHAFTLETFKSRVILVSDDTILIEEILDYVKDAEKVELAHETSAA